MTEETPPQLAKPDGFWKAWEQRREEAIMQFMGIVKPEEARDFVTGVEKIHQEVQEQHPDNIVIALRGGASISWALETFEKQDNKKPIKRIILPIGIATDINTKRAGILPNKQRKLEIIQQVATFEASQTKKLGKLLLIDEALSGGSINFFVENGFPVFKSLGAKSLSVIAVTNPDTKENLKINLMKDPKPVIPLKIIKAPLVFSDKRSLVDDLVIDSNHPKKLLPQVIHNIELKRIIEMITISYQHPDALENLLDGNYEENETTSILKNYLDEITSDLFEPKPFLAWLKQYLKEVKKPTST